MRYEHAIPRLNVLWVRLVRAVAESSRMRFGPGEGGHVASCVNLALLVVWGTCPDLWSDMLYFVLDCCSLYLHHDKPMKRSAIGTSMNRHSSGPVNLANSDQDNRSCVTIRNWDFGLSRLGVLAILLIEFNVSRDYQVQRCRMSAMHQCTCSPLTLRWNSQFFGFVVCVYLFRHLYTLCCMFLAELILCLLHPLLWLDGQKKTHFAKKIREDSLDKSQEKMSVIFSWS